MPMIEKYTKRWFERLDQVRASFTESHPEDYKDLVSRVIKIISDDEYGEPDTSIIHEIDDGDYQGTLVFLIPEKTYQPSNYFYVRVYYGSCSGCDTLQDISDYSSEPPTENQVKQYMQLACHVVQQLRQMDGDVC